MLLHYFRDDHPPNFNRIWLISQTQLQTTFPEHQQSTLSPNMLFPTSEPVWKTLSATISLQPLAFWYPHPIYHCVAYSICFQNRCFYTNNSFRFASYAWFITTFSHIINPSTAKCDTHPTHTPHTPHHSKIWLAPTTLTHPINDAILYYIWPPNTRIAYITLKLYYFIIS